MVVVITLFFYVDVEGAYFTGNTELVINVYKIISELALNDERTRVFKAALERMDESEVEFHLLKSTKVDVTSKGGETYFDFDNNRVVISVYHFITGEHTEWNW